MNDIVRVSKDIDLVYSPDDGGWYFQDYPSDRVSIIYKNRTVAKDAYNSNNIQWSDED
jgi:hypothetical protein